MNHTPSIIGDRFISASFELTNCRKLGAPTGKDRSLSDPGSSWGVAEWPSALVLNKTSLHCQPSLWCFKKFCHIFVAIKNCWLNKTTTLSLAGSPFPHLCHPPLAPRGLRHWRRWRPRGRRARRARGRRARWRSGRRPSCAGRLRQHLLGSWCHKDWAIGPFWVPFVLDLEFLLDFDDLEKPLKFVDFAVSEHLCSKKMIWLRWQEKE